MPDDRFYNMLDKALRVSRAALGKAGTNDSLSNDLSYLVGVLEGLTEICRPDVPIPEEKGKWYQKF